MNEQKIIDKAKLDLALMMISYLEGLQDRYGCAVSNGRCDECGKPLMFEDKETCEDCLCPEQQLKNRNNERIGQRVL